jgi:hypothetical protein
MRRIRTIRWIGPRDLPTVTAHLMNAVEDGREHVPAWAYEPADASSVIAGLEDAREQVEGDRSIPDLLREKLVAEISDGIAATAATTAGDDDAFLEWSSREYPAPPPGVIDDARGELAGPALKDTGDELFSADDLAAIFEATIRGFGLAGWTVRIDPELVPNMSVQPLRRMLSIQEGSRFTATGMRRLVVHELGSHGFRAVNSQEQPETLAAVAFGNPVGTEEGLAAWNERALGVSGDNERRTYAARVVAVELARRSGVVQVARELAGPLGLDAAARLAIRVKRGLRDPNRPGAYGKDQSYFTGLREVSAHLAAHPQDLPLLMAVKWPLADLPLARELRDAGRLVDARLLPDERLLEHLPAGV